MRGEYQVSAGDESPRSDGEVSAGDESPRSDGEDLSKPQLEQFPMGHLLPFKPPILVLVLVMAGLAANYAYPLPILSDSVVRLTIAISFAAAGLLLMASAGRAFSRADEQFSHNVPTSSVVESGPFRFSRNPVYLSIGLVVAGLAFATNAGWIFITFHGIGYPLLHYFVVKPEEEYLKAVIGDAYSDYFSRVRRWI